MNLKAENLISLYASKPPKHRSKRSKYPKLPAIISHNQSFSNLQRRSLSKPANTSVDKNLSSKLSKMHRDELKPKNYSLRDTASVEDKYDQLEMISNRNSSMRSEGLNIEQRIIQILSSSKLPLINERSKFIKEKQINAHIDSLFQRYQDDIKLKIKCLRE